MQFFLFFDGPLRLRNQKEPLTFLVVFFCWLYNISHRKNNKSYNIESNYYIYKSEIESSDYINAQLYIYKYAYIYTERI